LVRVIAGSGDEWGCKVGGKMRILNEKFYFVHETIFKFLSQMKGNSKIFKVKITARDCYCTNRPTAPRKLTTPLMLGFKFTRPAALPAGKDTPLPTE
jgi:hypothetical protein